jgi:hypothetical protein
MRFARRVLPVRCPFPEWQIDGVAPANKHASELGTVKISEKTLNPEQLAAFSHFGPSQQERAMLRFTGDSHIAPVAT